MLNQNLANIINKEKINEIAKETKFMIRKRKITALNFFLALVFRSSKQLPVSLRNLSGYFDKDVSRIAVHKKFNQRGFLFFKKCFHYVLSQRIKDFKIETHLLDKFNDIKIIDSSSWDISPALKTVFPGSGGCASPAACKVQLLCEYKTGRIHCVDITKGSSPDQKYSKKIAEKINKNDLVISDLGYWNFETFKAIDEKAYYISRLNTGANLWLENNNKFVQLDLENLLNKQSGNAIEFNAYLNKEQKIRVVAFRVPEEIANRRRANLIKNAKRKGRTPKKKNLHMCDWSMFVTNCDEILVPGDMIRSLYRIRWTIELIFKNWKSILNIQNCYAKKNEYRLLCEIYAKLIFAVILHNSYQYLNSYLWKTEKREISFWALCNYIVDRAQLLHEIIKISTKKFILQFNVYTKKIIKECIKYYQKTRKTSLQYIDEMIGDSIPIKISNITLLQQYGLS